ncbi:MAG: phosphomannomutase/phosphoglucomutase, partial [Clostridia bacterium]|nr:phosphomannomutase/phosphoglucomutase [Clostridia bacterium]
MEIVKNINKHIYRGYDIRGIYGDDLDENVAYTIGKGFGSYIQTLGKKEAVVGRDNRASSPELAKAFIKGAIETGITIYNLGVVTTPMYYFSWENLNIVSGAMVTASHNPKEYNGFKIAFDERGNACGEMIEEFRDYVEKGDFVNGTGKVIEKDIRNDYLELLDKTINLGDRKIKVVLDCGNAAGSVIVKEVYKKKGIEAEYLYCDSDPDFPNHHPDPSVERNLKDLKKKVLKNKADLGLAFDGDSDRVGIIDENGQYIPIDYFMIIVWRDIFDKVKNKKALYDVKCSKSLVDELDKLGIEKCCYRTGNSYMKAKMKEGDFNFGGEFSGHVFFRDKFPGFDDAMYAGLRLIEILSKTDKPLSKLLEGINKYYSTPEIKIKSSDDRKHKIVNDVIEYAKRKGYDLNTIDGMRAEFEDGWALVRASNTGPDITVRFESKTEEGLKVLKNEFMNEINSSIKKTFAF